jgi:hypothetical protein
MATAAFGPGVCKFTIAGSEYPVETEVTGGSVKHSYSEVERKAVLADTSKPAPRLLRDADALSLELLNDLSDTGLYALIHAHDLETASVTFTPNNPAAASWAGTVTLRLPDEIGAGEWGEDLTSTVELPAEGTFTFTPAA